MAPLPRTDDSLLVPTAFGDQSAWLRPREAAHSENDEVSQRVNGVLAERGRGAASELATARPSRGTLTGAS